MKPVWLYSVTLTCKFVEIIKLFSDTRGSFVDSFQISFSPQEWHYQWITVTQMCTEGGYPLLILWVFPKASAFSEDIIDCSQKFAIVEVEGVSPCMWTRDLKINLKIAIIEVLLWITLQNALLHWQILRKEIFKVFLGFKEATPEIVKLINRSSLQKVPTERLDKEFCIIDPRRIPSCPDSSLFLWFFKRQIFISQFRSRGQFTFDTMKVMPNECAVFNAWRGVVRGGQRGCRGCRRMIEFLPLPEIGNQK